MSSGVSADMRNKYRRKHYYLRNIKYINCKSNDSLMTLFLS